MRAIAAARSVGGEFGSGTPLECTSKPPGFVEIIKDEVRSRTTRGLCSIMQFMPTLCNKS